LGERGDSSSTLEPTWSLFLGTGLAGEPHEGAAARSQYGPPFQEAINEGAPFPSGRLRGLRTGRTLRPLCPVGFAKKGGPKRCLYQKEATTGWRVPFLSAILRALPRLRVNPGEYVHGCIPSVTLLQPFHEVAAVFNVWQFLLQPSRILEFLLVAVADPLF